MVYIAPIFDKQLINFRPSTKNVGSGSHKTDTQYISTRYRAYFFFNRNDHGYETTRYLLTTSALSYLNHWQKILRMLCSIYNWHKCYKNTLNINCLNQSWERILIKILSAAVFCLSIKAPKLTKLIRFHAIYAKFYMIMHLTP